MKFTELDLAESILMGLSDVNYTEATPIQEKSIPSALEGKDILGAAKTGSGKTGAFVIPILQQILNEKEEGIKALIISPTRELAAQIDEQVFAIGYHTGLGSVTIIGGEDFGKQADSIKSGVDILVATPGRLIDMMKVIEVDFSNLNHLVLDEADRMLDMGFLPDIRHILSQLPEKRQNLLFSATMPNEIQKLIDEIMNDPIKVELERSKASDSVSQEAYFLPNYQKNAMVDYLLRGDDWNSCIIFSSTKKGADKIGRDLNKMGINSTTIHGDRDQSERNEALHKFKTGEVKVIVATDVLARGIDIDDVSLIINYDVPKSPEDYIHRIGRTGRYDKSGKAITFVNRNDNRLFKAIEDHLAKPVEKKHRPEEVKSIQSDGKRGEKKEPRQERPKQQEQQQRAPKEKPKQQPRKTDKPKTDKREQRDSRAKQKPSKGRQDNRPSRSKVVIKRVEAATSRKPNKPVKHHKGFWGFIRSLLSN